jgi:hypothetical protein
VNVQPGATDQLFVDWATSGATIGVRVLDLEGNTTIARTTGFVEFPAGTGLYYLDPFTFPDENGSYELVYDDDGGTAAPGHTATEDLTVSGEAVSPEAYATTEELFRLLHIRQPTADQEIAGARVLAAASYEVDRELDADEDDVLTAQQTSIAKIVTLERAVEHWRQQESAFGLLTVEGIAGATERIARDTWERHANTLASAKFRWGIA